MTKFDILAKLWKIRDMGHYSRDYFEIFEGIFSFRYNKHSTGRGMNVYLVDSGKKLLVYYDYDWFHSCYEFNEKGKKHGHLIDNAPWIPVLEAKFAQFEKEILELEEKQRLAEFKQKQEKEDKDRELVEYFKRKF